MAGFGDASHGAPDCSPTQEIESIVAFIRTWEESIMSTNKASDSGASFSKPRPPPASARFVGSATGAWGLEAIDNPLARYPDRDWEKVYRDLWKYDSTFTFLCAPNDTHNCILNAYVRYGVVTRIGPTMRYGEATDLDGNRATTAGIRASARRAWR